MATTAETIAEEFHNDGQCRRNDAGTDLDAVCEEHGGRLEWRDGRGTDVYRWSFPDGSVITVAQGAWDLGYPGCFCWEGEGHRGCHLDPEH